jgi:hypothetical protein
MKVKLYFALIQPPEALNFKTSAVGLVDGVERRGLGIIIPRFVIVGVGVGIHILRESLHHCFAGCLGDDLIVGIPDLPISTDAEGVGASA